MIEHSQSLAKVLVKVLPFSKEKATPMKAKIGKIIRQKRPLGANGDCRDTAKCTITIDGVKHVESLGRWNSPESYEKYARLRYEVDSGNYSSIPECASQKLTLENIYLDFLQKAELRGKTSDYHRAKIAVRYAIEAVPDLPIAELSLRTLSKLKAHLCAIAGETRETERGIYKSGKQKGKKKIVITKKPWSRQYVNKILAKWKEIIHFGINQGYIPPEIWTAIKDFPLVKENDSTAPPTLPSRTAVDDRTIDYTISKLPPTIGDFVRILRGSGSRPSEICSMQVKDLISLDSGLILYAPSKHKTAHRKQPRYIAFSQSESRIIEARIKGKNPENYVFSPRDLMLERYVEKRQNRKTKVQPSQQKRDNKRKTTRLENFKEYFTSGSIGRALKNAIMNFNKTVPESEQIPLWTLYQVRHSAFTANSAAYGVEYAAKIAGHTSPDMARVYDHSARQIAILAAEHRD